LVLAAEQRELDLLALVLVRVVLHGGQRSQSPIFKRLPSSCGLWDRLLVWSRCGLRTRRSGGLGRSTRTWHCCAVVDGRCACHAPGCARACDRRGRSGGDGNRAEWMRGSAGSDGSTARRDTEEPTPDAQEFAARVVDLPSGFRRNMRLSRHQTIDEIL